jgi:long-chain acyl-CoA synthetase
LLLVQIYPVAVIVPDEETLPKWAASQGIPGTFADLCANPAVNKVILEDLTKIGKEGGLKGFEQVNDKSLNFLISKFVGF